LIFSHRKNKTKRKTKNESENQKQSESSAGSTKKRRKKPYTPQFLASRFSLFVDFLFRFSLTFISLFSTYRIVRSVTEGTIRAKGASSRQGSTQALENVRKKRVRKEKEGESEKV
jgi:hypothetical protein